ncbi:hypothetical protein ACFZAR_31285 [Streptomyces sp. NPDC008222]
MALISVPVLHIVLAAILMLFVVASVPVRAVVSALHQDFSLSRVRIPM